MLKAITATNKITKETNTSSNLFNTCFVFVIYPASDFFQQPCCCSVMKSCLFANLWTSAVQASLSYTIFQSLLKFMSTVMVMHFIYLILCCRNIPIIYTHMKSRAPKHLKQKLTEGELDN